MAPVITDTVQIIKVGHIHALVLTHAILDGGFESHETTNMMPKTSAIVPSTACDQNVRDARKERVASSPSPTVKDGIITIRIRIVFSKIAAKVR